MWGRQYTTLMLLAAVGWFICAATAHGESTPKAMLHVKVLDAEGRPVERVQICRWRLLENTQMLDEPVQWKDVSLWREKKRGRVWVAESVSELLGNKSSCSLPPATYRISATAVRDRRDPTPFGISDPLTISKDKPGNVTVQLQTGGVSLRLHFFDMKTKGVVPFAEHLLIREDGFPLGHGAQRFRLYAQSNGEASFRHVSPGRYTLLALKSAHSPHEADYTLPDERLCFNVTEGGPNSVEVGLKPHPLSQDEIERRWPFVVHGTVTDEAGQPVEGATITAYCGMGSLGTSGITRSESSGNYTLRFKGWALPGPDRHRGGSEVALIRARKARYVERNNSRHGELAIASAIEDARGFDPEKVILPGQPRRLDFVMLPTEKETGEPSGQ